MTSDDSLLIMSDGTSQLTWLDPVSLAVVKTITVSDHNGAIDKLNELEYINGFIYANVYTTNQIVKIEPGTGKITGRLDLTSLANEARSLYAGAMELNGVAFDPGKQTVYVTGKMWPKVYEIRFGY